MSKRTTQTILRDTEETLNTAKFGLQDFLNGPPERKMPGLRNLIVFGRAVTNVLQNLRSTEPAFDEWYAPYQKEMSDDKIMKHIYRMRSIILKQGTLKTSVGVHIKSFSSEDIKRFGPPPVGAKRFFIGDQIGGTGWEVELPDGTIV